jgi:hypothetical protein
VKDLKYCNKCGCLIPDPKDSDKTSDNLCNDCFEVWREFYKKYFKAIREKWKHGLSGHSPQWSVFLGEIKDDNFPVPEPKRVKVHFD